MFLMDGMTEFHHHEKTDTVLINLLVNQLSRYHHFHKRLTLSVHHRSKGNAIHQDLHHHRDSSHS